MTPEQKLIAKLVLLGLFLLGVFGAGYGLRDIMADRDTAQATLSSYISFGKAINERDRKHAETTAKLTALEAAYTEQANALTAENDALRADVAVAQRMRLKGASCPAATTGGQATAGVDPAAQVQLSEETRQLVFDLRKSIVDDTNALTACQAELAARVAPPG